MKDSRLQLSATQGDPQAIANFLGNNLAGFSLWVTAITNQHYLDLCVEGIDTPDPEIILEPIQQLICQLKPEKIELIKISGRKFGEATAQWQETFLLSEVIPQEGFQLKPMSVQSADQAISKRTKRDEHAIFADIYALVLAVNEALQELEVAAKIERINQTLSVELRSIQVPEMEPCLHILYEIFARLGLPDIQKIRVQGFAAKQLMPSWVEEFPTKEVLLTSSMSTSAKKFTSFRQEEEFWRPIGVGFVAGLLVLGVPLLNFAFRGVTTFIFDLTQAIAYMAMGYAPSLLKSPFQGGGIVIVTTVGRSPWLIGLIYGFWGYLLYLVRRVPPLIIMIGAIAMTHSLICWTKLAIPFAQVSGHLAIWALSFILLYCAFGSYSCRNQGERSLYVVFSIFFSLSSLSTYFQMFHRDAAQANWLAFLGLSITLLIPFLSYKLFTIESLWLPTVQKLFRGLSHPIKKSSLD